MCSWSRPLCLAVCVAAGGSRGCMVLLCPCRGVVKPFGLGMPRRGEGILLSSRRRLESPACGEEEQRRSDAGVVCRIHELMKRTGVGELEQRAASPKTDAVQPRIGCSRTELIAAYRIGAIPIHSIRRFCFAPRRDGTTSGPGPMYKSADNAYCGWY